MERKDTMSKRKRFFWLGSMSMLLLAGCLFTFSSRALPAHANTYSEKCPPSQSSGSSGTWVSAIQLRLDGLANNDVAVLPVFPLHVSGSFDADTKTDVAAYQQNVMGITDGGGAVGDRTWASLGFCTGFPAQVPSGYNHGCATSYPPTLSYGNISTWVQALQQLLNIAGYEKWIPRSYNNDNWWPLGLDGNFGAHTKNAVEAFQNANGLNPPDGIVGHQTWTAMGMCY